ncbi:MAG: DUF6398 domain-containing protein [Ktedonobacteraceae bacterium]
MPHLFPLALMRYNEDVKEAGMPKRSPSQHVPKDMQARFDEITRLTDTFCQTYLNDEYRQLCRELTATLCRKRPSPLARGQASTWACGIIHALGMVNFLFDSSQTPHIAASQIWEYFELSSSTMQAKSKQIRDLLGMYPMDPDWSTPSMVDKNPLIWMLEVNGLVIDVRHAPREIQEAAFRQGLIPYIPET